MYYIPNVVIPFIEFGNGRMIKVKLKYRLKEIILPALLLAITFGVCGPLQLYLTNVSELWFSLGDIWWLCLLCGAALFLLCAVIGILLPQKVSSIYGSILFGVALGLYIQGNFVSTDYGVLDGREINWGDYKFTAVVNTLLWIFCIAIPVVFHFLKPIMAKKVLSVLAICVIAIQMLTVGIMLVTTDFESASSPGYISNRGINEVSKNKNVIIFVLDSFDQEFFEEIYTNEPKFLEPLSGFTYFANATGMYPTTKGSLPYIMTGKIYKNEKPYKEYVEEAFKSIDIYQKIYDDNFEIGLYTDSRYVFDDEDNTIISNYEHSDLQISSLSGLSKSLYKFVSFRYFPHVLKQYVWFYSGEFDQWKQASINSSTIAQPHNLDNINYYNTLIKDGLQLRSDKNIYHLIHIKGAHLPYELNENIEVVTDGSATYYSTAKASLKIVYQYIKQLKELEIYDNTMMVIMADHGKVSGEPTSPLLLVKRLQEQGAIKKNNAPVCQGDLIPTIMSELGMNSDNRYGRTLYDFFEGEERFRKYFYYNLDWQEDWDYLPQMVEYEIDSQSNDISSYHLINYKIFDYNLGDEISFADSETAHTYCVTGFSIAENNFTWTSANSARMAFKLNEVPKKDLLVHMGIERVFNNSQKIIISVGGQLIYESVLQGSGIIEFIIPHDLLENDILEINFEFPNAISPAELNLSSDIRRLALAFTQMRIEQTDLKLQDLNKFEDINLYQIGTKILFDSDWNGTIYFESGISNVENDFAWSLGTEGQMKLKLDNVSGDLKANFNFKSVLTDSQRFIVKCGDQTLYEGEVTKDHLQAEFIIPENCIQDGILILELSYPDAVAPSSIDSESSDARVLAVAFSEITFAST